ncbi:MAG TPA: hypothetical protein VG184_10920, partial [Acidimicrobiales bacterium]|nr:hypothetical protein [Acidimicrobiales bacterium]
MRGLLRRGATLTGVAALLGSVLAVGATAAGAAPGMGHGVKAAAAAPVPFGQAKFSAYSNGPEVHLNAVQLGNTNVAQVDQAYSSAAANSSGLRSAINDPETFTVASPSGLSGKAAYGSGTGLEVGLATPAFTNADPNQIKLAGKAEAAAPPDQTVGPKVVGPLNLGPIGSVSLLSGTANAVYDPNFCPIGEPLSYGNGQAANVQLLSLGSLSSALASAGPLLNTAGPAGSGTTTAESTSDTYLSANGDNTFGVSAQTSETVAPLTANILGLAQVEITVQGNTPSQPIGLKATTTGGSSGASVSLVNAGLVNIDLIVGGTRTNLLHIPISAITGMGGNLIIPLSLAGLKNIGTQLTTAVGGIPLLGGILGGVVGGVTTPVDTAVTNLYNSLPAALQSLLNVGIGSIEIDSVPHPIGGSGTLGPTVVGGTLASGAIDLVKVQLGVDTTGLGLNLPSLPLVNLEAGHMEVSAADAQPIICTIPMAKTVNPNSVTAGNNFTQTIQIPDPTKLALLACSLSNVTATDTITDLSGNPTFKVLSVDHGGTVTTNGSSSATITWTGLSYTAAPVGSTPTPPIQLHVTVSVPADSPGGVVQDLATATGTPTGCNGGISGTTNLGGVNNSV